MNNKSRDVTARTKQVSSDPAFTPGRYRTTIGHLDVGTEVWTLQICSFQSGIPFRHFFTIMTICSLR